MITPLDRLTQSESCVIYEYRDSFSDRFITASVRHNGIQIRAAG